MEMSSHQIEQLWNAVCQYLLDKHKEDCAVEFINTLLNLDVNEKTIKSLAEYDDYLESAIAIVFEEDEDEEELYFDED